MNNKIKFELNRAGVKKLLQSNAMQKVVNERADAAISRLGSGYGVKKFVGHDRAHATVFAESYKAKRENLENNTILKAVQ